ncbi:sensor histidine kinase [Haloferula chungangensis]|uniref:histidine kinase n=1 Tax=Haloferula chungangensis TaxID=1048331 RepID=A0ABW2L6C1_9BACT
MNLTYLSSGFRLARQYRALHLSLLLLVILGLPADALFSRVNQLQDEIHRLEDEKTSLPGLRLNPSPWTLGYRSSFSDKVDEVVTIELRFITEATLDLIALIPSTYSPDSRDVDPFGFPKRFLIESIRPDGAFETIVDHRESDYEVTGIEPQLFPLAAPVQSSGIRISALRMGDNPSWWPTAHVTTFSEVMAFSGDWNAALDAEVSVSSESRYGYVWHRNCLVDGFSLFSPVDGKLRNPFDNFYYTSNELTLLFDLGSEREVDELRLWPVVHSLQHNFPQASGIGFPSLIRLEVTDSPEAMDSVEIHSTESSTSKPGSSPLMIRFSPVKGRYFRLHLEDPVGEFRTERAHRIALSEIELLKQGELLSRNMPPFPELEGDEARSRTLPQLSTLTDGLTTEGKILPLRTWIEGLAENAELSRRLVNLHQELVFARRQERERWLFLVVLLVCLTPLLVGLAKLMSNRRWKTVRNKIAGDLHDEIGANASCLVHLTELIKETVPSPTHTQSQLLDDALATARLTSSETRNFIQLLETEKMGFDVRSQIQNMARQILVGLDYDCRIDRNARLRKLPPSRQWDLLLFIKEALNNITKHARASHAEIHVERRNRRVRLSITDNGIGLRDPDSPPRHLSIRAKRLNAEMRLENMSGKGTRIHLELN